MSLVKSSSFIKTGGSQLLLTSSVQNYNNDDDEVDIQKIRERFERDFVPRFGSLWRKMNKENEKKATHPHATIKLADPMTAPTVNFMDAIARMEVVKINVGNKYSLECDCGCAPPIVKDDNIKKNEEDDTLGDEIGNFIDDKAEVDDSDEDSEDRVFYFTQTRNKLPKNEDASSDDNSYGVDLGTDGDHTESINDEEIDSGSSIINDSDSEENEFVGDLNESIKFHGQSREIEGSEIIDLLSSDSDESDIEQMIKEPRKNIPSKKKIAKTGLPKKSDANNFKQNRDLHTKTFFEEFNQKVFEGRLQSVTVEWSNKLNTTAGITRLRKKYENMTPGKALDHVASIELSTKVVDSRERLRSTLLHELIHAAVWILE
jgi:hypothetical protein